VEVIREPIIIASSYLKPSCISSQQSAVSSQQFAREMGNVLHV
jgi:hypothetical protein